MARKTFNAELGYAISAENGDTLVEILSGSGAPGGDGDIQDNSPVGSLFLSTAGLTYKKIDSLNAASDWEEVGNVAIDELSWRNEKIVAVTGQVVAATIPTDPTGWSDNDSGLDATNWNVGDYIITGFPSAPVLQKITVKTSATSITTINASQTIANKDTFVTSAYLPDPASGENSAIVHFPNTGTGVKIADVDWNFADGINMATGYASQNGTISNADSVNSAIEKLDGNQQDIQTASGLAQGDVDYGTFTGNIIPDSSTSKQALQALETSLQAANFTDSVAVPAATPTAVGPVLVDDFNYIEYECWIYEDANEGNKEGFKFTVLHDGESAADATLAGIDDALHTKLKKGKVTGLTVVPVLSGTGAAQTVAMQITTTNACTIKIRRTAVPN